MTNEAVLAGVLRYLGEAAALVDLAATPPCIVAANSALAARLDVPLKALQGVPLPQALGLHESADLQLAIADAVSKGASFSVPVALAGAARSVLRCEVLAEHPRYCLCFLEPVVGATAGGSAPVAREDWLTGLRHAEFFEDVLRRDLGTARRDKRELSLFAIDIDALGVYADTFGRVAADAVVRSVARTLANCFRRASDVLVRGGEGRFFALAANLTAEQAESHGRLINSRVRDLHLHHPRAPGDRVVTVSVGLVHGVPPAIVSPESMIMRACGAAETATHSGPGQFSVTGIAPTG